MDIKNVVIAVLLTSLLSACSMNGVHKVDSSVGPTASASDVQQTQETKLPDGFTIDTIKNALSEYVNYRLWLYPQQILDAVSDKDLDPYIGKSVDVEIRVYRTGSNESVYAKTSVGDWLAMFKSKNRFIAGSEEAEERTKRRMTPTGTLYLRFVLPVSVETPTLILCSMSEIVL